MPIPSPPVDPRSLEDVTRDTAALVSAYSGWRARGGGRPDAGSALIRIFGAMAQQVLTRLNKVPDQNFLAYLNLIGVSPRPPRAACVALTFSLAPGAPDGARVPRGTLVGASTGDVVFETELDLETTTAKLAAAFVRQPDGDQYTDATAGATGGGPYRVFMGDGPMEHSLYLAADEVLSLPAATSVVVTMTFGTSGDAAAWQSMNHGTVDLVDWAYYQTFTPAQPVVVWEYWDGASWTGLPSPVFAASGSTWTMTSPIPAGIDIVAVNGRSARWVRARLRAWPASVPAITGVTVSAAAPVTTATAAPDKALYNTTTLDIGKDFYPLGQQPIFSDALYLGSLAALSHADGSVALDVAVSDGYAGRNDTDHPTIAWEVWDGSAWTEVGRSGWNKDGTAIPPGAVNDGSQALTATGQVTLTLPSKIAALTLQGITSTWLRARLVQGGYGTGVVVSEDGTSVTNDGYRPPVLKSVTLSCNYTPSVAAACVTCDDLSFEDEAGGASFVPFTRTIDTDPALYLGFDQPFGNHSVTLYVSVAPLSFEGLTRAEVRAAAADPAASPEVDWEYWNGSKWSLLGADDGTRRFAMSGLVRLIGPVDFAPKVEFGQSRCWIRARLAAGGYAVPPRAARVATNTAMGLHATTTTDEVLGSSNREPRQTFSLSQTPVLERQQIEVMEIEDPSPDDLATLEEQVGARGLLVTPGGDGSPTEVWVRWTEVPNFEISGPGDRHYMFDFSTGQVRFGDGSRGMLPPSGSGNVRAAWYQAGGGVAGNCAAYTVDQMKTSVSYVSRVTNPDAASGGADAESLAAVVDRGPRILRHRDRAVTVEDFEDLAREASADVARVTAVTPSFDPSTTDTSKARGPGHVLVVLVPQGTDPRPSPGLGLLQEVGTYLRARSAPAVQLQLSGPSWIAVSAQDLSVVPINMTRADAIRANVVQALDAFLHPLTGGFDGRGWQFAELPKSSDVYRLVASIQGVYTVKSLTLAFDPVDPSLFVDPDAISETTVDSSLNAALVCSGTHNVRIVPQKGGA